MTSTTHSSPAATLPLEVVEIIIAFLSFDAHSLRSCTLTCYSWYIAAVPHLYHTLRIWARSCVRNPGQWLNSLQRMHKLGLLPLVKSFQVRGLDEKDVGLSPKLSSRRTLRQFRALANVQDLWIDYLDIPSFMPQIQRYFDTSHQPSGLSA